MNIELFSSHNFHLSRDELEKFSKFLSLFIEYNSHTNLSAIRDEDGIVEKHFVDSLYGASVILEYGKNGKKLLDIGSGGGFPGIPLSIVMPDLHITLLDSIGKKVRAMNYFIEEIGLKNITAIQERAEILGKDSRHIGNYDFIVSRATAYITDILRWSLPFLRKGGRILLYKMPNEDEKKDMIHAINTYSLILEGELEYMLSGKIRIIYVFRRKD